MRLARHTSQPTLSPPQRTAVVPAVLSQVIAIVDDTGRAHVSVDGIDHPDGPVSRDELGKVLAAVAEGANGPVRVEIREPDGSRYADILQPRPPGPVDDEQDRDPCGDRPVLRGEGFLPGETVLVAVVAATIHAGPDGAAPLTDPPAAPGRAAEVVLFGSASGTIVRGSLPARSTSRWRRR